METELHEAVLAASVRTEVCEAVNEVYRELAAAIELRKPICKTSGRCCRFEEFGHRLYVSTMELAKFVRDLSVGSAFADASEARTGSGNASNESGNQFVARVSNPCFQREEHGLETRATKKFSSSKADATGNKSSTEDKRFILPILTTTDDGQRTTDSRPNPGCPFQIQGLCSVHQIRPFGCRIFFCDETSTAWQHEQYERLHGRLRQLHDRLHVPYYYVEWRFALGAIGSLKPT